MLLSEGIGGLFLRVKSIQTVDQLKERSHSTSVSILKGPYHHGVEVFYSKPATSLYSKHREYNGELYNEKMTYSFSNFHCRLKKQNLPQYTCCQILEN